MVLPSWCAPLAPGYKSNCRGHRIPPCLPRWQLQRRFYFPGPSPLAHHVSFTCTNTNSMLSLLIGPHISPRTSSRRTSRPTCPHSTRFPARSSTSFPTKLPRPMPPPCRTPQAKSLNHSHTSSPKSHRHSSLGEVSNSRMHLSSRLPRLSPSPRSPSCLGL